MMTTTKTVVFLKQELNLLLISFLRFPRQPGTASAGLPGNHTQQ